jgi:UDP-N-acetyl-2-amino-2-deoxyglucuronate dehydrogenase
MTARPVRLAVIGLGMAVKPHAQSLSDLQAEGQIEVLGAWSRSAERRAAFAAAFPLPVTADLEALLARPDLDAALVVTPPDAREALVQRLASAGKHILMEKPVERTTEAAERIVRRCEAAAVTLGIVFQHRFRDAAERLRQILLEGALGELATVELAAAWWRPQSYYDQPGRGTLARDGGGVLMTQAIHSLDLMLSLTGPVVAVTATAGTSRMHRMETEDFVAGGLTFANGALGSLFATTAAFPGDRERLVLTGTAGAAQLVGTALEVRYFDGRHEQAGEVADSGSGADPMAFPYTWHKRVIADFCQAIREGRPPRVSGRDALHVHRLIDALLLSARQGRGVSLPGDYGLPVDGTGTDHRAGEIGTDR